MSWSLQADSYNINIDKPFSSISKQPNKTNKSYDTATNDSSWRSHAYITIIGDNIITSS